MFRPVRRPLTSVALAIVLLAGLAAPVLGWSNGPDSGNGYGTHDWIVDQAFTVFGPNLPSWLEKDTALLATDDPDKVFYATNEHVFNEKGYGRGAVDRITTYYHQALAAHQAGDDHTASIAFGWMAHYYGDILQPFHTNYAAIDLKTSHSRYEHLVDDLTSLPNQSPGWMTPDRTPDLLTDVRGAAIAAAAYSRHFFPELYREFHANETLLNARVTQITGYVLKRASSDLANMLYSIDQGVDVIPAATVSAKVRYTYVAKYGTQTVYVAVKDAAGRALQGVRVDIAFPKPTGGTTLIRRYTTADGKVTAYHSVGASPYGVRRDVKVTVRTGAVTMTPTPWFMTTRRLATGTAGFKSWVNDATVHAGQTLRIASRARDTSGHGVPKLKVTWTITFANGTIQKLVGYTDPTGKALATLPITDATPMGTAKVSAKTQSASVTRTSSTSFRRY
ncbi:MAG: zinc dependent phospholipase C family protein [Chloroflexota bacterium]